MSTEKFHKYRGDVKALWPMDGFVAFVTTLPDGAPTALYRLDYDKLTLHWSSMNAGGTCIVGEKNTLYVGGTDKKLRVVTSGEKDIISPFGPELPGVPVAVALLADNKLAALADTSVCVLDRKGGKLLQTLELPEAGTALAVDPTGRWIVAGTAKGTVAVFESEGKDEFALSEQAKLHEGAVTALLFELEELRFLSAGADQKLLTTFARGSLEPEDRGKSFNHTDPITTLKWGTPPERFYSGSKDASVKAWPKSRGGRPVTQKDGVATVVDLTVVTLHKKPQLIVSCQDNSLRFFPIDEEGKPTECTLKLYGFKDWSVNELTSNDPPRREAALKALAEIGDNSCIELIAKQVDKDSDHNLRALAAKLLAEAKNPRAGTLLEPMLKHNDGPVRLAALEGLRKHRGMEELGPLDLALKTERADVGKAAVKGLEELAAKDDQALARLMDALDANNNEIREAALASLENVHDKDSADANLTALKSKHADLRRLTLIRLYQRKMLDQSRVQSALRWRTEDSEQTVRQTAFLLTLYTRPKLVAELRKRDPELERQLKELEGKPDEDKKKEKEKEAPTALPKAMPPAKLSEDEQTPLLQATASRALDTCLRGARGLALLGEHRAFGVLLQLSREDNPQARAEVCRALAALDDPRSVKRLRSLLYDPDASVRDAAFTALARIFDQEPLQAAESGLNAATEDIRRRGLTVLLAELRKKPPRSAGEPGWQLLLRALNDSFPSVRMEAFKASLNLKIAGGGVQTYRFVLQSIHPDVRREVLTETMAQHTQDWAWALLLEFFNDHDPKLREEAFDFATKKSKDLESLTVALQSQYIDVRKMAVQGLIRKRTKAAQEYLIQALDDQEREVRLLALDSLIHNDVEAALAQALEKPHADVRVRAARALARHGNKAAAATLLQLATAPEPQERERVADWLSLTEIALEGLADLDPSSELASHMIPLLKSPHASIRKGAAKALVWLSPAGSPEALRQALQHSDPQVKYRAAFGLAIQGDPAGASLVFSQQGREVLTPLEQVTAAHLLGSGGEDLLVNFLDDGNESLRDQALVLMMLLEWKTHQGSPARSLAALAAKTPRMRLAAAQALEMFAAPNGLADFTAKLFNDRGEDEPWKVTPEVVDQFAELLARATPHVRARTVLLLDHLGEKEQARWNQGWGIHSERFVVETQNLANEAKKRAAPKLQTSADELLQLAFGAYVGLVRDQSAGTAPAGVRIRQTALSRILALAEKEKKFAEPARPVFVQAMGDPNQVVRFQAFDQLQKLGMDNTTLGGEAIESGNTDLAVKGLQLLTAGAKSKQGQKVLENVMLSRTDHLATEAAKLLIQQRGEVPVAVQALGSVSEDLRGEAVNWLVTNYEKDPKAQEGLRDALKSRYAHVRLKAAVQLGAKKDQAAFPTLVKMLAAAQDTQSQQDIVDALVQLGNPAAAPAFLDRVENDPAGNAVVDELFSGVNSVANRDVADRLFKLVESNSKFRSKAISALTTIAGCFQYIPDPEDENPDKTWEKKEKPRHNDILARLLEVCFNQGDVRNLTTLIAPARWARTKEVDPVLGLLVTHPDAKLRPVVVEAVGWRARKRGGPTDPLLKVLKHKDNVTQFLAAEGLARARRPEGLTVLLSAVEYMTEMSYRQRAVQALGELADPRALDTLLKLASDREHALQDEAAEALGHMSRTERSEEIFKLLERYALHEDYPLATHALRGLRYFNTPSAWHVIRRRIADQDFTDRESVVELLGYNDDPATRDLLLKLLRTDEDSSVVDNALTAARRLWGADSLEPDYAILQNPEVDYLQEEPLTRVCKSGDVVRMLDILPRTPNQVQQALVATIMNRDPLPVKEAQASIGSLDEMTVHMAARVLGRAGSAASKSAKAIEDALNKWLPIWEERRHQMLRLNTDDERLTERITPCLQSLIWAAGRMGVAKEQLARIVTMRPDDRLFRVLRLEAAQSLSQAKLDSAGEAAMRRAATGNDPELRTLAVDALARQEPKQAASLANDLLSDRVSFNRLANHSDVSGTVKAAASQLHYQGVALPRLIALDDEATLVATATNKTLPEATRLGAIEGLGMCHTESAEKELAKIGTGDGKEKDKEERDLRKAAWRALRRSKRARAKHAAPGEQPT